MNKAEMADRLAARTVLNRAAARDVVDSIFAVIGEALANGEEVRIAGFGTFTARTRPGPYRPQPQDRRGDFDIGFATGRRRPPSRRNQQVVRVGRIQVAGRLLYGALETDRLRDCLEFEAAGWPRRAGLTRLWGSFTEVPNFGMRFENSGRCRRLARHVPSGFRSNPVTI